MRTRIALTKSMIVAVALATVFAFTGCSTNPGAQPDDGVGSEVADGGASGIDGTEELAEKAAEDGVDIQADGDLPKDFPAEVPLVDGKVQGATGTAGKQWAVFLSVDDAEASINLARKKLTGAGFQEMTWENPHRETMILGMFSTDDYLVTVSTNPTEDAQVVQYVVRATR